MIIIKNQKISFKIIKKINKINKINNINLKMVLIINNNLIKYLNIHLDKTKTLLIQVINNSNNNNHNNNGNNKINLII